MQGIAGGQDLFFAVRGRKLSMMVRKPVSAVARSGASPSNKAITVVDHCETNRLAATGRHGSRSARPYCSSISKSETSLVHWRSDSLPCPGQDLMRGRARSLASRYHLLTWRRSRGWIALPSIPGGVKVNSVCCDKPIGLVCAVPAP